MEKRSSYAVLFECERAGESLRVGCRIGDDGVLHVDRLSCGPVTQWCFGEEMHSAQAHIDAQGVDVLLAHYGLDAPGQLPGALQMEFTGYECTEQLCDLAYGLGVACATGEHSGSCR